MRAIFKTKRERLGISQAELADQVGVSEQTIQAIEEDRFVPSTTLAFKIARFFNVTVEDIFKPEQGD